MRSDNTTIKPWHDCPTCAKCDRSVCVMAFAGGPHLFCPACGDHRDGTTEELEQARKADEAWEAVESTECWGGAGQSDRKTT